MIHTETKSAQAAVIFCAPDHRRIEALSAALAEPLGNYTATVLSTGRSRRRREGFVVVEVVPALPELLLSWLKAHPEVRDYMVYDVPSQQIEQEVTEEALARHSTPQAKVTRRTLAELGELAGLPSEDGNDEADEPSQAEGVQL